MSTITIESVFGIDERRVTSKQAHIVFATLIQSCKGLLHSYKLCLYNDDGTLEQIAVIGE